MKEEFQKLLEEKLDLLPIKLQQDQILKFYKYYELLEEWNKVMNLTAITEMEDVIIKHFVDSLSLIKVVNDLGKTNYKIIDVGTGAGFPGIPLKIVFPDLKITLMDSLNKRVKFLNEVIDQLDLKNMDAIHGRAEELGRDKLYREQYDFCLSRAVANLSTLSEYCLPFVKEGGFFISYKSGTVAQEAAEAKHAIFLLSGKIEGIENFTLPGADAERSFVKIKKVEGISKKYPRKPGVPAKEPLK